MTGRGRLIGNDNKPGKIVRYELDCKKIGGMLQCKGRLLTGSTADLTELNGKRLNLILETRRQIMVKFTDDEGRFYSPGSFDS